MRPGDEPDVTAEAVMRALLALSTLLPLLVLAACGHMGGGGMGHM